MRADPDEGTASLHLANQDVEDYHDVVNALNGVQPYDWSQFLRARLEGHGAGAPLDGLSRGGYKLVYTDTPSEYFRNEEERRRISNLSFSLGMVIGSEGKLTEVIWDGTAFQKGLTVGTQIIAVDGIAYNVDRLKAAIRDAQKTRASIELLVKNGDHYRTIRMDYHDGLRYPHLERTGTVALLDQILAPR